MRAAPLLVLLLYACEAERAGSKQVVQDASGAQDAASDSGSDTALETAGGEVRGPYGLGLTPKTGDNLGVVMLALSKPAQVLPGQPESTLVALADFDLDIDTTGTGFEDAVFMELGDGGVCRVVAFKAPSEFSYSSTAGKAGDIAISAGASEVKLHFDAAQNGYVASGVSDGLFKPGQTYTAKGDGGEEIGSFDVAIAAPSEVAITNPELGVPLAPGQIDRSQHLKVSWTTGDSAGFASLMITSIEDPAAYKGAQLACEFPDSGHVMIPPDILQILPATPKTTGQAATFVFYHGNRADLGASGLNHGEFSVSAGVTGSVLIL